MNKLYKKKHLIFTTYQAGVYKRNKRIFLITKDA